MRQPQKIPGVMLALIVGAVLGIACNDGTAPTARSTLSPPAGAQHNVIAWYACSANMDPLNTWTCTYTPCIGACIDYPDPPTYADTAGTWHPCEQVNNCQVPSGPPGYYAPDTTHPDSARVAAQCSYCIMQKTDYIRNRLALNALKRVTADPLCQALKTYILKLTVDKTWFYTQDTPGFWAFTLFDTTGVGPDLNANVYFQDSIITNKHTERQNARTLIHEAVHGYFRIYDQPGDVPESTAVHCVP